MNSKLKQAKETLVRLFKLINAPLSGLPHFGKETDSNSDDHYIIHEDNLWKYTFIEGGIKKEICSSAELDDILYKYMERIVSGLVGEECKDLLNNVYGPIDHRRIRFTKAYKLMKVLNSAWSIRFKEKLIGILKTAPYDDNAISRVRSRAVYAKQGLSNHEAQAKSIRNYPFPEPILDSDINL